MDRKAFIILALCLGLLVFGNILIEHIYHPIPVPVSTNQVAVVSDVTGTNVTAMAAPSVRPAVKFVVQDEIAEDVKYVTNDVARYTFTSRGGGLKLVELVKYPQTVSALRQKKQATNEVALLNTDYAPPVLALVGSDAWQDDGVYQLTPIPDGMRAEKTLTNGLTVTKEFHIATNSSYLVSATVRLKNNSSGPVKLPTLELAAGASTPMGPTDSAMAQAAQAIMWYNGSSASTVPLSYFNTNTSSLFGLMSRIPKTEYLEGSNNVSWVSAQNQFFALATMPETNAPAGSLSVRTVNLPPPSLEEIQASSHIVRNPQALAATLDYALPALSAGQQTELRFNLFAGPKEYQRLTRLDDRLKNRIDLVMGFGSWYGPISKGLLRAMNWLYDVLGLGYGWIVVLITVILRLAFWPLTRASTRSMKRMQELQPQMKALQAKYKDDPAKLQSKTWEFYKKNKVNPLGGCLPMMLQIPVFFGFFGMLRNAIELRGAHFLWIGDLSQPDTICLVPGFNFPVNLMPLLMAGAQFWQANLTPPSAGMDPAQQKMMRYMPLVMVVFFYNYSSGLALYWTVSTLMTVLQTKLTKTKTPALAVAAAPVQAPRKRNN